MHYHFSGICGTGMASLAVLLKKRGHQVTGSDENIYPPMSDLLHDHQIHVHLGYDAKNLQPHPDYVIIGNALSRGNSEVEYALKAHLQYLSMAEVLKNEFIRGRKSIVITGTHGKTTTTSLTAWLLDQLGQNPGFMIGGIPENFGFSARDTQHGSFFVTEGDEYDTCFFDKRSKFFHYLPDYLIINNLEFDHADIFQSLDEIKRAFTLMFRQIPANGLIIANGDDQNVMEIVQQAYCQVVTFGTGSQCDVKIIDPHITSQDHAQQNSGMTFTLQRSETSDQFSSPLSGEFNVRNVTGVITLLQELNIASAPAIQKALITFKSPKRRLQCLTSTNSSIRVFDDFAHHPTAIQNTLASLRQLYPEAKIFALYEPRSNTSIRKFHQEKMAASFINANEIIIYKLFRAERIAVDDQLNLPQVINELQAMGKTANFIDDLQTIEKYVTEKAQTGDIILVMSQGNFGGLAKKLANHFG